MKPGKDILLVNLRSSMPGLRDFPNPGMGALESCLRLHGVKCRLVNISAANLTDIDEHLHVADVVGISVMDHLYPAARNLTDRLRDKTIVWGGWTATALPEFILKENPGVDYVVLQEGEKRLLDLLDSLKNPELFDRIDGIAYRNTQGDIVVRPPKHYIDLNELPIPTSQACLNKLVFVELARGCHGRCHYCQEAPRMRFKRADRAADEIQYWYDRGYRSFYIGGANSLVKGALVSALAREVEVRGMSIRAILVGRPDDVLRNRHYLEEVFAGTRFKLHGVEIGIEANTQHALDLLGRRTTPEMNREAMDLLLGLAKQYSPETRIYANMILFSHMDMTLDDFVENVRFMGDYRCSRDVMTLQLFGMANTPTWREMAAKGFQQESEWGLQIFDYPFADADVGRLFEELVQTPLRKTLGQNKYSFTDFAQNNWWLQRGCYRRAMEFYRSGNIHESVMGVIDS